MPKRQAAKRPVLNELKKRPKAAKEKQWLQKRERGVRLEAVRLDERAKRSERVARRPKRVARRPDELPTA